VIETVSLEQAEFDRFLFHLARLLIIRFPPGAADRAAIDPFQFEEGVNSRRMGNPPAA
jgi:hypothetical protein